MRFRGVHHVEFSAWITTARSGFMTSGIHPLALWTRNRKEVGRLHSESLLREGITVTDSPNEYPVYTPDYFAVFFTDPTGIRWELAHTPRIPMPWDILKTMQAAKELRNQPPRLETPPRQRNDAPPAFAARFDLTTSDPYQPAIRASSNGIYQTVPPR